MADPHLYRMTYDNGRVKYGGRRVLGPALAALREDWGYHHPVKIERVLEPAWEDVTTEFIES